MVSQNRSNQEVMFLLKTCDIYHQGIAPQFQAFIYPRRTRPRSNVYPTLSR